MMIETLDDIIEEIADTIGRWGAHFEDHPEGSACECRMCFTVGLQQRILDAVEIENAINEHHAAKRKKPTEFTHSSNCASKQGEDCDCEER